MGGEASGTPDQGDWFRGVRGWLVWGIPIAILVISPSLGTRYLVILRPYALLRNWPVLLAARGCRASLRYRCAAAGRERMVHAVRRGRDRRHRAVLCARMDSRPVPIQKSLAEPLCVRAGLLFGKQVTDESTTLSGIHQIPWATATQGGMWSL
jgi:hypothetical protein